MPSNASSRGSSGWDRRSHWTSQEPASVDACAGLVRIQCAPDEEVATLDQTARPLLSANRPEHNDGSDQSKLVTVGKVAGQQSGSEAAIRRGL